VRPTRRGVIGAGVGLLATPALADVATDAAPPASDAKAWSAYEARLRERLADAGGCRFDDPSARSALEATNAARKAGGAPPVEWHEELAAAARAHAGDLAQRAYVEHLSPEGFDPSHRFWLLGRTTIGSPSENIAYHRAAGPPATSTQLLQRWRKSPGHWRNMLRASHTHAAYGVVRGHDRVWMVGLYTRPVATLPEPLPFHAHGPDIARALRAVPSEHRPRLSVPQGSRLGRVEGAPPVMQLTAIRRADAGAYDVVGGPIFLAADG
jgi:uncharacterized protein YkwD